jgi:GUN4-like
MVRDIIEVVSKLFEFSDSFKKAGVEKRESIAKYFSRVGECLKEVAQQLKSGEMPHSRIAELRDLAEGLPEAIGQEITQDKAKELSELLKRSIGNDLENLKKNEEIIRQIQECAGKFDALAFRIRYPGSKSSSAKSLLVILGIVGLIGLSGWFIGKSIWSNSATVSSPNGINYELLQKFLKARDWKSADAQTMSSLLEAVTKARPSRDPSQDWLDPSDIRVLPCSDLKTINQLWSEATKNRLGFVIQSRIWQRVGGTTGTQNVNPEIRRNFSIALGWQGADAVPLSLEKLYQVIADKSLEEIPEGYLPSAIGVYQGNAVLVGNFNEFASLTARLQQCGISK